MPEQLNVTSTDPNDLQAHLCSHLPVIHSLSPAPLWGLSTCVLTQNVRLNLTHDVLVFFDPWFIFLAQQDLEKSYSLCEWFPKHWKLPPVSDPSTGCLHPCRMGATDKIIPPQPWCSLYVCMFGFFFLALFFFLKAIPECTKAKKKKKIVFGPHLTMETKLGLWRFMPQVVWPHFNLVCSLPHPVRKNKEGP